MTEAWDTTDDVGRLLEDAATGPALPAHLYFHIPFCRAKCSYCDFYSVTNPAPGLCDTVFTALKAEVTQWATMCLPGAIDTVYFGGGTPSLHAEKVADLLEFVKANLPVRDGAEITVEGNPDSLTAPNIHALANAGATRISVGVQSFDDEQLRFLGRLHDSEQAVIACRAVIDAGLDLSIDLICGVTEGERGTALLASSIDKAVGLGAQHLSVYPLQVEEGTPLALEEELGVVVVPDSDMAAAQMQFAESQLERVGLCRYEVANYAVPGHEAKHNTAYWLGRPYLGIGPAAHSMFDATTAETLGYQTLGPGSRVREGNASDIGQWLSGHGSEVEVLTAEAAKREDVMLGMRMASGVADALVQDAGLAEVFESLERDGLALQVATREGIKWTTTTRGWLLGNEVFGRIWCEGAE